MRNLRTQEEIINAWHRDSSIPLVSICCMTYNHEAFIEDALEGFLIQETDFPFEILIHEDASTDRTAAIVREYEKCYPKIVKPIYQTENQYSKGVKIISAFLFARAKGMYFAICDGDDFWTDKRKLQVQIQEMEMMPEVDISFHPVTEVIDNKFGAVIYKRATSNRLFSPSDAILGGGAFMPTSSLIVRERIRHDLPTWFDEVPVGDLVVKIYGSLRGGALFLKDSMSVYRRNVPGSWNAHHAGSERKVVDLARVDKFYVRLEAEHPTYTSTIRKKILKNNFRLLRLLVARGDIHLMFRPMLTIFRNVRYILP